MRPPFPPLVSSSQNVSQPVLLTSGSQLRACQYPSVRGFVAQLTERILEHATKVVILELSHTKEALQQLWDGVWELEQGVDSADRALQRRDARLVRILLNRVEVLGHVDLGVGHSCCQLSRRRSSCKHSPLLAIAPHTRSGYSLRMKAARAPAYEPP